MKSLDGGWSARLLEMCLGGIFSPAKATAIVGFMIRYGEMRPVVMSATNAVKSLLGYGVPKPRQRIGGNARTLPPRLGNGETKRTVSLVRSD